MWCQWVKAYLLKGRSFWTVRTPCDPSWVWRKILSLRHLIYPHIKFKIGNGDNVFLWYDNWHPLGSLWHRFGPRILYDTNLPDSTKVSSIVSNSSWKWPISNSWEIKEWISSTPLSLLPSFGSSDTPFWNLAADGNFSIQSAWDCWRDKGPKVTWSKLIWGPPSIPRGCCFFVLARAFCGYSVQVLLFGATVAGDYRNGEQVVGFCFVLCIAVLGPGVCLL
ncbi:uncharacterized protein LOC114315743 [Camellia sinensis]|uniref:uncharacterized protein LOC114315743 n=1 Tax=Camellia sinensis TaxID=4442 RepID=UPI001036A857|nr:uncharacterized protein LOC114315743 [Camellia sinensis]